MNPYFAPFAQSFANIAVKAFSTAKHAKNDAKYAMDLVLFEVPVSFLAE